MFDHKTPKHTVCHQQSLLCDVQADIKYRLAAVNFFLGCVGVTQVARIVMYQQELKKSGISQVAESNAKDAVDTAKSITQDPEGAAKNAMR